MIDPNLEDSVRYGVEDALGKIAVGNQEAVAALLSLLQDPSLSDSVRSSVKDVLREITVGDREAIKDPNLNDLRCSRVEDVLRKIAAGGREIALLVKMLSDSNLKDWQRSEAAEALGKIAVNKEDKEQAIAALLTLLKDTNSSDSLRYGVAEELGKIAFSNQEAIAALLALLKDPNLNDSVRSSVEDALGKIAVGNQEAIVALLSLLKDPNLDNCLCFIAALLGKIAVDKKDKEQAIAALIKLLPDSNLDDYMHSNVSQTLSNLLRPETMRLAIGQLKNYVIDEVRVVNFRQFNSCYEILWKCAQTLPYSTFYTAWHPSLPIIPFDSTSLHHQLNRPHTAILDLSNFHSSHPTDIATELTTRIYLALQIEPIPTDIDTIPKLKQVLINLNLSPHPVLICYHPHPTLELVRAIDRIEQPQRIQRIWLTNDDSIDRALPPEQANLVTAIQSAIDRFAES